ncbi:MAG: SDR family oxidoreductase [Streptosporangiaceae bacterium]
MKTVLITGTSTGIGLQTAVQAAEAGWQVIATMRDPHKAAGLRAALPGVDVRPLDVVDDASVQACVAGVLADHGHLDAVVNNAGSGHLGTIELETLADVRQVMEVNFFGAVRVTRAALPHLRAVQGRLVTVTSVGGIVGQPFNEAYCAAKFALEGWLESLAPVVRALGVQVSVIEPGPVATEFVANIQASRDVQAMVTGAGDYRPLIENYLARTSQSFVNAQSAVDVAAVCLRALTDPEPHFRYLTSDWVGQFTALRLADPDGSRVQAQTATWIS